MDKFRVKRPKLYEDIRVVYRNGQLIGVMSLDPEWHPRQGLYRRCNLFHPFSTLAGGYSSRLCDVRLRSDSYNVDLNYNQFNKDWSSIARFVGLHTQNDSAHRMARYYYLCNLVADSEADQNPITLEFAKHGGFYHARKAN